MMIREFTERTGYEPSFEEYHYIEESYYEFDGNKDEFCKWWKKASKSGEWAKELKLRKRANDIEVELKLKMAEQEDNLNFYRAEFQKYMDTRKENEALRGKLQRVQRILNQELSLINQ